MNEQANITINGKALTPSQSFTLQVAVMDFLSSLKDGLGDDDHGREMTRLYTENLSQILSLMYAKEVSDE